MELVFLLDQKDENMSICSTSSAVAPLNLHVSLELSRLLSSTLNALKLGGAGVKASSAAQRPLQGHTPPDTIYPVCDVTGQFPRIAAGVGGYRVGRVWPRLPERTSIIWRNPARLCLGRTPSFWDSCWGNAIKTKNQLVESPEFTHKSGRQHRQSCACTGENLSQ